MDLGPDVLTTALDELQLRCEPITCAAAGTHGWRLEFPRSMVSLHVLMRGECLIDADLPLWRRRVERGEMLVLNGSVPGALRPTCEDDPLPEVVSARVHLEAPHGHPMIDALPPLIRARAGRIPRSFGPSIDALLEELAIPMLGRRAIVQRVCEVLVVQALRMHLGDLSWDDRGWFRALADPVLRQHLAWTVDAAGRVGGLARSAGRSPRRLGARFLKFAGTRPSQFLRTARARRAALLLRDGETDLERVAALTGFGSRQALARAFRRELGISPTEYWRNVHRRPFPRPQSLAVERALRTEAEEGCRTDCSGCLGADSTETE